MHILPQCLVLLQAESRASRAEAKAWAQHERDKGNEMFKVKNYKLAMARYDRAIEHFPEDAEAYGNRAAVHLQLKDWSASEAECSKGLSLKPE